MYLFSGAGIVTKERSSEDGKKFYQSVVFAALLLLGLYYFLNQLKIDECLDAGGSWNYEKVICEKMR